MVVLRRGKMTISKKLLKTTSILFCLIFSTIAFAKDYKDKEPWSPLFSLNIKRASGAVYDGRLIWIADVIGAKLFGIDPSSGKIKQSIFYFID